MSETKKVADDAQPNPGYGGGRQIVESATRGKRPGDRPADQRERVMPKADMERKPGMDPAELAEIKKYSAALEARRGPQRASPTEATAPAPTAGAKAGKRS